jgi:hypothetical protein
LLRLCRRLRDGSRLGPGPSREALLPAPLFGLELRDLVLDGRVQRLTCGELLLDGSAPRRALRDDAPLIASGAFELAPAALDLRFEAPHLRGDAGILVGDAVGVIDPIEKIRQARGTEEDVHRIGLGRRVELHESPGGTIPGALQIGPRHAEALPVRVQLSLDPLEPERGTVPRVDGAVELHVDGLDLREDDLCLLAAGLNLPRLGRGAADQRERSRQGEEERES